MNILQRFDRFVVIPQEPWRENIGKNAKMHFFVCFGGVEMHLFARNDQASSNFRDLKAGPTQIDPRGSSGIKNSAIPS